MQHIEADFELEMVDKSTLKEESSAEIRKSMERLPKIFQGFLTWLTTEPLQSQKRSPKTSAYQITTAFISLFMGLGLSLMALNKMLIILPISLLITVSGMRKLQVVIYHHCSHGTVFKSKFANLVLGEIISIMLVIKDFPTYRRDHMAHHQASKLLTYEDETTQDLSEIGLLPGVPKNILWKRLLLSFISPFSHIRWMLNRVRNCFLSLNLVHNLIAMFIWILAFALVNYFKIWNIFLISWILPLTLLYHISRILRLVAEHRWPAKEIIKSRGKMFICLSTVAVFNGEKLPNRTGNHIYDYLLLMYWLVRVICIHMFARIFVLVGDTPCHDYHHRRPGSREWSNYIYARYEDKYKGCIGYPLNYKEVWGLFKAIDQNLNSLSQVKA